MSNVAASFFGPEHAVHNRILITELQKIEFDNFIGLILKI